jgi:hypothetical protein
VGGSHHTQNEYIQVQTNAPAWRNSKMRKTAAAAGTNGKIKKQEVISSCLYDLRLQEKRIDQAGVYIF